MFDNLTEDVQWPFPWHWGIRLSMVQLQFFKLRSGTWSDILHVISDVIAPLGAKPASRHLLTPHCLQHHQLHNFNTKLDMPIMAGKYPPPLPSKSDSEVIFENNDIEVPILVRGTF